MNFHKLNSIQFKLKKKINFFFKVNFNLIFFFFKLRYMLEKITIIFFLIVFTSFFFKNEIKFNLNLKKKFIFFFKVNFNLILFFYKLRYMLEKITMIFILIVLTPFLCKKFIFEFSQMKFNSI